MRRSAVRGLDQHAFGLGAEKIDPRGAVGRARLDVDAVEISSWPSPRRGTSRSVQRAKLTGDFIAVGGDMADVVDHASPVSFSGRVALVPCGK